MKLVHNYQSAILLKTIEAGTNIAIESWEMDHDESFFLCTRVESLRTYPYDEESTRQMRIPIEAFMIDTAAKRFNRSPLVMKKNYVKNMMTSSKYNI